MMSRLEKSEIIEKNYSEFTVPDSMVLFSRIDLIKLLESHNFKVLASYSLQIPIKDNPKWNECLDEQSNVVGVIAIQGCELSNFAMEKHL